MTLNLNSASRISDCIVNTLSQQRLTTENNQYSIAESNLLIWDSCPVCSSSDHTLVSDVTLRGGIRFFSTDICNHCMHVFRKVSPNLEWFTDRWKQISTGEMTVYNKQLEEKRRVRYELYYGLLHKYKKSGKLLDVGAAYGSGTQVFISRGFDAEALEPEDDRSAYIAKTLGITCYNTTLESMVTQSTYDLILFSHCLEHLNNPSEALKILKSRLSASGVIYLEVPIVWNIIDWQDSFFMAHKHNFTERNLKQLIRQEGFVIEDSFLIPDNDGFFCNLGLVLTQGDSAKHDEANDFSLIDPAHYTQADLQGLYAINLPAGLVKSNPLHFVVEYIDNFYHIMKGDKGTLISKGLLSQF